MSQQMGEPCLRVHWCTILLNSIPLLLLPLLPLPPQMTSILSEQLCTLADGCLLMYSVADRDRYCLQQQHMGAWSGGGNR